MTANRIVAGLAGLLGAAGIALAALGSHAYAGTNLSVGATMLSLHAPALLALAAARRGGLLNGPLALLAAAGMVLGALLFSGDLLNRAVNGAHLFPFAAPTGGTTMMLSWLVAALAGLVGGADQRA